MTRLVSVVIPAYDAEQFIQDAMASVISQTYPNIELIVVNDGSTDATLDIAMQFADPRIRVVSQPNRGLAAARNRGMAESSGELIAFLDADDRWFPTKLERQIRTMQADPTCVAIGSLMRYESRTGKVLGISGQVVGPIDQERIKRAELMPFPISSILFDRATLERVGGSDEDLRVAQDIDLLARVAAEGVVAGLDECLGSYMIHGESASARHHRAQKRIVRYVRARILARQRGQDLTLTEFEESYKRTTSQAYGDTVQGFYRRTAEHVAEHNWIRAAFYALMTVVIGPRYTLRRFLRQRSRY